MAIAGLFAGAGGIGSILGTALQVGALAYRLIRRPSKPAVEGPRLADTRAKGSQLGLPIPVGWGRFRATCSLLQATDKTEHVTEEEVGGKGGPTQTVRNYRYSATAAWLICDTEHTGPITRVNWLRLNGVTVYQNDGTTEVVDPRIGDDWEIHLGASDQAVDSDLEAIVGAGQQPAYRGLAYFRITDLDLTTWNQSLPVLVEAEVQGAAPYLGSIVQDIFRASGLDSDLVDVDALTIGYGETCEYKLGTGEIVTQQALQSGPAQVGITGLGANVYEVATTWDEGGTVSESSNLSSVAAGTVCASDTMVRSPIIITRCGNGASLGYTGATRAQAEAALGVSFPCMMAPWPDYERPTHVMWGTVQITTGADGLIPGFMRWGPTNFSAFSKPSPYAFLIVEDGANKYLMPYILGGNRETLMTFDGRAGCTPWYLACGQDRGDMSGFAPSRWNGTTCINAINFNDMVQAGAEACTGSNGTPLIPNLPNKQLTVHFGIAFPSYANVAGDGTGVVYAAGWYFEGALDLRAGVEGYTIPSQARAMDALDELRAIQFLDIHHNGAQLKVAPRSLSSVRTLDWSDDLMWLGDGQDPITTTTDDPVGLPDRILIRYPDAGAELETGSTLDAADIDASGLVEHLDTNVTLTAAAAAQVAERLWIDRASPGSVSFALALSHADLEADDVVTITGTPYGEDILVRITSAESDGAIIRVEAQIVYGDCSTYVSDATADERDEASTVATVAGTTAYLLDLPLLLSTDDEDGVYVIGAPDDDTGIWGGYTIYETPDGGTTWQALLTQSAPGVIGTIDSLPGTTWYNVFDEGSSLVVTLTRGTLESKTDAALVTGSLNAAAIGSPAHGWEIIQFGQAELTGTNQWTLTHLLRARKGTDPEITAPQVGDAFVLLNLGAGRIPMAQSRIGQTITYRAVSANQAISEASDQTLTYQGMAWRPYTVAQLEGVYDAVTDDGSSHTVTWARRARKNVVWSPGYSAPLDQTIERYRVRVYDGATLESTQTIDDATTATVTVASGQTRTIKVAQYGDVWGYGPESEISITN